MIFHWIEFYPQKKGLASTEPKGAEPKKGASEVFPVD